MDVGKYVSALINRTSPPGFPYEGVRIEGGSQPGISYVIHSRAYTSSERQARREFESYKISAYSKGDAAWIVGDWQGGRSRKFSGDFVITVPRNLELAKVETDGGSVKAQLDQRDTTFGDYRTKQE